MSEQIEKLSLLVTTSLAVILLSFFIALNSKLPLSVRKATEVRRSITQQFASSGRISSNEKRPRESLYALSLMADELKKSPNLQLNLDDSSLTITTTRSALFFGADSQLTAIFLPTLETITALLSKYPLQLTISSEVRLEESGMSESELLQLASLYRFFRDNNIPASRITVMPKLTSAEPDPAIRVTVYKKEVL